MPASLSLSLSEEEGRFNLCAAHVKVSFLSHILLPAVSAHAKQGDLLLEFGDAAQHRLGNLLGNRLDKCPKASLHLGRVALEQLLSIRRLDRRRVALHEHHRREKVRQNIQGKDGDQHDEKHPAHHQSQHRCAAAETAAQPIQVDGEDAVQLRRQLQPRAVEQALRPGLGGDVALGHHGDEHVEEQHVHDEEEQHEGQQGRSTRRLVLRDGEPLSLEVAQEHAVAGEHGLLKVLEGGLVVIGPKVVTLARVQQHEQHVGESRQHDQQHHREAAQVQRDLGQRHDEGREVAAKYFDVAQQLRPHGQRTGGRHDAERRAGAKTLPGQRQARKHAAKPGGRHASADHHGGLHELSQEEVGGAQQQRANEEQIPSGEVSRMLQNPGAHHVHQDEVDEHDAVQQHHEGRGVCTQRGVHGVADQWQTGNLLDLLCREAGKVVDAVHAPLHPFAPGRAPQVASGLQGLRKLLLEAVVLQQPREALASRTWQRVPLRIPTKRSERHHHHHHHHHHHQWTPRWVPCPTPPSRRSPAARLRCASCRPGPRGKVAASRSRRWPGCPHRRRVAWSPRGRRFLLPPRSAAVCARARRARRGPRLAPVAAPRYPRWRSR
eukprot:scaffold1277_cov253-Pinguiococcus_pyrenoidosus.AAC.14